MRLYSYWRSSSAWRVRIALAYKQVPFELVTVHLVRDGGEQHSRAFRDKNPLGQVPVLELDPRGGQRGVPEGVPEAVEAGGRLTQSMAIIEYLEERFPQPALLPTEPLARARARQCAETVNAGIQPFQNIALQAALRERGLDPLPLVRDFIRKGLTALEELARAGGGPFMVGAAPTYADVYLVPQLHASRRMGVDVQPFSTLLAIEHACQALPAFQAAHADAQPDREAPPPAT